MHTRAWSCIRYLEVFVLGVLLVLGVCVLAFLCGRLQITVNHLAKRVEQLEVDVASFDRMASLGLVDKE